MTTTAMRQRDLALEKANSVRTQRAALKGRLLSSSIRSSRFSAAKVLLDPPDYATGMDVKTLLSAVRRFGPYRVNKCCLSAGVSTWRKLGDLTERQREALAIAVRNQP